MLVHVSPLHTDGFSVEGSVPDRVIEFLRSEFGPACVSVESSEEYVNPFETEWFKESAEKLTPGSNMKFYRKQRGMTQKELAETLGTTKQAVCSMEHNRRPISKNTAKRLAFLFHTSPARFI